MKGGALGSHKYLIETSGKDKEWETLSRWSAVLSRCVNAFLMHGCAILVFYVYYKEKEHWMQTAYPPGSQQ